MEGQKNDRKSFLLAALAILTLLNVAFIYLFYQERQKNKEQETLVSAKTEEVISTKAKLDSISVQLDAKIAEIQELGGNVDSLILLKDQLTKDKANLSAQIKNGQFVKRDYQAKIDQYVATLTQKDVDIAKLKEELGIVTTQNQELTQKVTGLETDKQSLQKTFEDSVGSLSARNRELADKVTLASALKAENVRVDAISARGKERDGGEYRAKKIDKIKIDFNLAENPIAKKNEKEIYLRLLDPTGAILSDMATGSGSFVFNGNETIYTAKQRIDYDNTGQAVAFIYSRGQQYKKGKHAIELYAEGFRIGTGEFIVK